jgi:two-component system alkaline phosphatase synthesis response regulator PhoP
MSPFFRSALLVEDEVTFAKTLSLSLKKLGIASSHVTTLKAAEKFLKENEVPDLILLDRMLPDGEGLDLCRKLRAENYHGCILVLSAQGDSGERVTGLDSGADDYLPKPFSWEELGARLRALARRTQHPVKDSSLWAPDESHLRIRGPKGWVTLTQLEFKLTMHLIAMPGQIITREELLKDVWGFKWLPKTRTVDFFMGRLRKHFEADPNQPRHFITIRGAGYRFDP